MAADDDTCSDAPSETEEKGFKMKCCITKSVSVYVCVQCFSFFHKSCIKRNSKLKLLGENKVICCPKDTSENSNKESVDRMVLEHQLEKAETQNFYLSQMLDEVKDKNNILKINNQLLMDKITTLEEKLAEIRDQNINISYAEKTKTSTISEDNSTQKKSKQNQRNVGKNGLMSEKNGGPAYDKSSFDRYASDKYERLIIPQNNQNKQIVNEVGQSTHEISTNQEDGFIEVNYKKQKFKKRIGTGVISEEQNKNGFAAAERKVWLHLYRIKRTTEATMIEEYIKGKPEFQSVGIMVKEMPTDAPRLKSFVVTAPLRLKDHLYDVSFWPEGVGVKRFSFERNKDFLTSLAGDFL